MKLRETESCKDQVVKSLRNWARPPARMAERRGRFEGSKEVSDTVVVVDKENAAVLLPEVASATVITSSIYELQSLSKLERFDLGGFVLIAPGERVGGPGLSWNDAVSVSVIF